MYAHNYFASHYVFNELAHSVFNFFIVFCFLDIAFYFVEEFFLCLLFVGIEQQALLISFIRQFIHINANKKANLRSLRYEFPDSKIPGSSKIPYKCIKEMHFLILENAFYFFKKGIFFFIGEKICSHNQASFRVFIRSLGSTFKTVAILTSISNDGCEVLEHQREMVASFF